LEALIESARLDCTYETEDGRLKTEAH
jgi:hypothetical protein